MRAPARGRRGSLAAQEARDLEVVCVVRRLATDRRRLTDRPLDPRSADDRGRRLLVVARGLIDAALGDLVTLTLEFIEEITLSRRAPGKRPVHDAGRLAMRALAALAAIEPGRDVFDHPVFTETLV